MQCADLTPCAPRFFSVIFFHNLLSVSHDANLCVHVRMEHTGWMSGAAHLSRCGGCGSRPSSRAELEGRES